MAASTAETTITPVSCQQLEGISKALGDTTGGLKAFKIAHLLRECGMPDPTSAVMKRHRLYNSFAEDQFRSRIAAHVTRFVAKALNSARYMAEPAPLETRVDRLNSALALTGYQITERGEVRATEGCSNDRRGPRTRERSADRAATQAQGATYTSGDAPTCSRVALS